jgi:hypothetical protein
VDQFTRGGIINLPKNQKEFLILSQSNPDGTM